MRALLFNPWITDYAAFDFWTRPLNLLRLSTLLKQCGWEVELYDCLDRFSPDLDGLRPPHKHRLNPYGCGHYYRETIPAPPLLGFVPRDYKRYGIPPGRVEHRLRAMPPPDLAIVAGMMTYWYPGAFDAIRMIRRIFHSTIVVLGGVYATLCRDHAVAHSGADRVVTGRHWPEIVNELLAIAGDSRAYCRGGQGDWIEPDYDWLKGYSSFPILTSSGCPLHCPYCATHSLWPNFIQFDREAIVDSIERLVVDFHATDFAFYDDALLINKEKHILPILEEIIRRSYGVRFHAPNALHVRQINRETAALLKRAGFTTVRLGFETAHKEWQRATGAKVYTEEYITAIRVLREAGFTAQEIGTYLLLGLPGQSLELVKEACEVVADAGSEIRLAMYSPVPNTRLFASDRQNFRFNPADDPLLQNNSLTPWRLNNASHETYQQLKRYVAEANQGLKKG